MAVKISRLDDEYVKVPAGSKVAGAAVDPTGYTVSMAFMAQDARPAAGDYNAAAWETDATVSPARYKVKCKPPALAGGRTYGIWIKIDTGAELVQRQVDELVVD